MLSGIVKRLNGKCQSIGKVTDMRSQVKVLYLIALTAVLFIGCKKKENTPVFVGFTENVSAKSDEIKNAYGEQEPTILINPHIGVGDIRFTMTIDEMISIMGEQNNYDYSDLFEYDSLGIWVKRNSNNEIVMIICGDLTGEHPQLVEACKCRTKEGIGMASSEKDIISTYGEPSKIKKGERLHYKELGITFVLANDKVHCIVVMRSRKL